MGKSVAAATSRIQNLTQKHLKKPSKQHIKSTSQFQEDKEAKPKNMEANSVNGNIPSTTTSSNSNNMRLPLSEVVSDCVKRWFKDTLKEAKAGDINMQILVGQMYYSGYGTPRDPPKGRIWMTRASRTRSSVWRVSDKHPGYNASDSDSDGQKGDDS